MIISDQNALHDVWFESLSDELVARDSDLLFGGRGEPVKIDERLNRGIGAGDGDTAAR